MPQQHLQNTKRDMNEWFDERNNYFTGKYMTARDFRDEQRYLLSHHRWHQWGLHGWGIVWGLEVSLDENGKCVTLHPGVALDCFGRELVVRRQVRFDINELRALSAWEENQDEMQTVEPLDEFLLGLRFCTRNRELVPLILDEHCSDQRNLPNRAQEYARIGFEKMCPDCWKPQRVYRPALLPKQNNPGSEAVSLCKHHNPDDCECPSHSASIGAPCQCREPGFVPLAHFKKTVDGEDEVWIASDRGCRYVQSPFYGEALTHIVGINWRHAGTTELANLMEREPVRYLNDNDSRAYGNRCPSSPGRIIVTFDRPLAYPNKNHEPLKISTYFSQLIEIDFSEIGDHDLDGDDPPEIINPAFVQLSPDRMQLLIDFPISRLARNLPARLRLTLNCDMVLDERGRAVDGDHIAGRVACLSEPLSKEEKSEQKYTRSGDGCEGGAFVSWTRIPKRRVIENQGEVD